MRRILSVFLILCVAAPAVQTGDLASSVNLFFIKRSKNANEVHYDASVNNCAWEPPAVDSYWRDLQDGPGDYEEIKSFERAAYGFEVKPVSNTEIKIQLRALPEKAIKARLSPIEGGGCNVSVRTRINGEEVDLRSVYVYAEEGFLFPKVHYIEILGYSDDGEPVWERIPQTKRGRNFEPLRPDASLWESGAPTWGRG